MIKKVQRLTLTALLCSSLILHAAIITLPEPFCIAADVAAKKGCDQRTVETAGQNPIILVLIHGTFSSDDSFLDAITFKKEPFPQNLLSGTHADVSNPLRLTFKWSGKNSDEARIEGGTSLAEGLNNITQQCTAQGIQPKIVLIAHSHGGNVIAVASNKIEKPIDLAIFLGTPVLRHNQTQKNNSLQDLYLPKNIGTLLLFYSMNDMVQTIGALQEQAKRRYGPIDGINLYNIRLLVNGQEPLHTYLYNQLIDDNILELSSKIKNIYKKNKNLVANIAPNNKNADHLIAIKKYSPKDPSFLTGESTDTLWPDWEKFEYAPSEVHEMEESEKARTLFKNVYNHEFLDTASLLDRSLHASQAAFCLNVAGKLGRTLGVMPQEYQKGIAEVCCPIDAFKSTHPQAARALKCSDYSQENAAAYNKTSFDQNFCMNAVGPTGRFLSQLDQQTQEDLNKRCCTQPFAKKHPHASKALNCII